MTPLLAFGANNGHEVLFTLTHGQPTSRKPQECHPNDVVWVDAVLKVVDGYMVYGWSSAARINTHILRRLLTVRTEWSRK
jgi:hypothetical protein